MIILVAALQFFDLTIAHAQGQCRLATSAKIVRFDDRAKRALVITQTEQIDSARKARAALLQIQKAISACRPSWSDNWSVSFFTESKFAGYKTEPQLQTYVTNGAWGRAYLAEYTRSSQKLVLYPLDPKRIKSFPVLLVNRKTSELLLGAPGNYFVCA